MLRNLLFPAVCAGCERELAKGALCGSCRLLLPSFFNAQCPRCHARLPEGNVCASCRRYFAFTRLFAGFPFSHPIVKALIGELKYKGIKDAVTHLAQGLRQYVVPSNDAIAVPIPLHRKRKRARGFNQAALLVQATVPHFMMMPQALERQKETPPQVGLSRKDRFFNIEGAFVVPNPLLVQGKTILLFDDVVTTGATMNEAAKTLKTAGAKEVWACVAAQEL